MTWLVRPWTLRHTSDDAGFSMIEVVMALLILAVVTSASLAFFINNLHSFNGQSQRQQAVYLADQQLETVQSLPVASMVAGRTSAVVNSLFATTAATKLKISSQDDTSSASDYDPTATTSSTPTVPTTFTKTVNGVPYTIDTFIDTCWYTLATGLCGPTSGSATTREDRVSVDAAWQSNGQCLSGCDYSTSTIVDPSGNPLFNSNISTPSGGITAVGSVAYSPPAVPQINNDVGGTCTTNGNTFTGHTKVVLTGGVGIKSGARVWISTGGGDIPLASIYQPVASEVDFCLQTADVPGGYTISVINPDGGHFQVPITEVPNIGDASSWNATNQNVTLTGSGFEPGAIFSATNGTTFTGTSSLVTGNTTADSVKLLGFVGPKDGGTTTITLTNPDASTDTYVITAPAVTARSTSNVLVGTPTNITLTGTGFQSGTMSAVLVSGSGTATVTAVAASTSATLKVQPTTVGSDVIYVYNDDGGITSSFTITVDAQPTVASASPTTVTAGTPTTVTVIGTGFLTGLTATTTNGTATVTSVSADGKTVTLSVTATSTNADAITLTNPDGGFVSGPLGVISALTSFTPNPPVHSTATAWVVNGAGFATGATVTITENGAALTKTFLVITSTGITFKATTSSTRTSSSFVVTVTNPDGTVATRTQTMTPS